MEILNEAPFRSLSIYEVAACDEPLRQAFDDLAEAGRLFWTALQRKN
jgi:hypothetical protein